jgi:hypothetical protein
LLIFKSIITIGLDFNNVYYVPKKNYSLVAQGFLACFHFQILCDHVSLVIVMSSPRIKDWGDYRCVLCVVFSYFCEFVIMGSLCFYEHNIVASLQGSSIKIDHHENVVVFIWYYSWFWYHQNPLWRPHVFFSLCHVIVLVLLCFCNLHNMWFCDHGLQR